MTTVRMEPPMKSSIATLAALLFAIAASLPASTASARDYKLGALEISSPWSRATPRGADTGAGYLTIRNTGTTPDRLISAALTAAATVQIHEMTMDNGVMRMRPLANGLEIKPGESVTLRPNGFHVMFMGLKAPLVKGQTVAGSLTFEKAGTIDVEFAVEAMGSSGPSTIGHDQMHMDHMH